MIYVNALTEQMRMKTIINLMLQLLIMTNRL
jgi:hypothetical protein